MLLHEYGATWVAIGTRRVVPESDMPPQGSGEISPVTTERVSVQLSVGPWESMKVRIGKPSRVFSR